MSEHHDNLDDFREFYAGECSYNLVRNGQETINLHVNLFYDTDMEEILAIHGNDHLGATLNDHLEGIDSLIIELSSYKNKLEKKYGIMK